MRMKPMQQRIRLALLLALAAAPTTASADDISFKLEPGVAIPLSAPQSDAFNTGGAQSIKVLFGLTPYFDLGPATSFMFMPAQKPGTEDGIVWGYGAGGRLKRPHDATTFAGISPWLDADLLYMRTGGLNRPGFDAAAGLAIPIDEHRTFWIGPFVRYAQTLDSDKVGFDSRDAKTLIFGLSFEAGTGVHHSKPAPTPIVPVEIVPTPPPPAPPLVCADRDGDGIPDAIDRCPDVAGKMEDGGCPSYTKVIVKKDKLELKEKLYFAWDQATLEPASAPILDEVVQALKDNPRFRVQIEGHTDSSGADDHNQTLSEQRADAVREYLVARGIANDRLVAKGFSSSVPIDTNTTAAGRENNRRVEFVVNFVLLNDGNTTP
jgi:outer membrane protein OmpA-like peptidoglycan-associated protein